MAAAGGDGGVAGDPFAPETAAAPEAAPAAAAGGLQPPPAWPADMLQQHPELRSLVMAAPAAPTAPVTAFSADEWEPTDAEVAAAEARRTQTGTPKADHEQLEVTAVSGGLAVPAAGAHLVLAPAAPSFLAKPIDLEAKLRQLTDARKQSSMVEQFARARQDALATMVEQGYDCTPDAEDEELPPLLDLVHYDSRPPPIDEDSPGAHLKRANLTPTDMASSEEGGDTGTVCSISSVGSGSKSARRLRGLCCPCLSSRRPAPASSAAPPSDPDDERQPLLG